MSGVTVAEIVSVIVALFGGGVLGVVAKAVIERKKTNAEADSTSIKSILEIDQRMNERMAKLEERVANLEQENYLLKTEKLNLEKKTLELEGAVEKLEAEKKELYEENCRLKEELEEMKK
jgi:predicted RNase H-like nuclease (RuvC/YqgF family)